MRRASGSVLTWRRAQLVLLSAQAMEVSEIARVTFTSEDRVRDVLHNFNLPGRRGVVDDISHEGLRVLLHQEGVSFQR